MSEKKPNRFLFAATPVVFFLFLVYSGLLGINFGIHWDEVQFTQKAVDMLTEHKFYPGIYYYPSFCFYLAVGVAKVHATILNTTDYQSLMANDDYQIWTRIVFLVISSLTVIWVYLLSFRITKSYWAAVIAGLIVCISYEFSYHSRWAVSDCIAVQFATLSVLMLFLNTGKRNKIIFSSLIAGIAAGTKYTAGIVSIAIVVYILSEYKFERKTIFKVLLPQLLLCVFILAAGFVLTTPGSISYNHKFLEDLEGQKRAYALGHLGYTISAGPAHLARMADYLIFVLFSKYAAISFLVFLSAFIGFAFTLIKKQWLQASLFFTMLIYVLYVSSYHLMIVRNLLFILPFFAVSASIGIYAIGQRIPKKWIRIVLASSLIGLFIYSGYGIVTAAESIKNKSTTDIAQILKQYLQNNKDKKFIFSLRASKLPGIPPDTHAVDTASSYLVFYKDEVPHQLYKANIRNQFYTTLGQQDVNLDYYPTWSGGDRLVVMEYGKASEDILFYALKGEKARIDRKLFCDFETINLKYSCFVGKELLFDTVVNEYVDTFFLGGIATRTNQEARSGSYSLKLDKKNPDGVHCTIRLKAGCHYFFTVWRKDPRHGASLVIENKEANFFNAATDTKETDENGWELLRFDYLATEYTRFRELSVNTWQPDTLSSALFDDLTIRILEKPPH